LSSVICDFQPKQNVLLVVVFTMAVATEPLMDL